jgi:hypothetical protein
MITLNEKTLKDMLDKGGATLYYVYHSGAYMDMSASLDNGYAVSFDGGKIVAMDTPLADMVKMINRFAQSMSYGFVGLWVDDNKLYIDRTIVVYNKDNALRVAKEQNQKAIYDYMNKTSLSV